METREQLLDTILSLMRADIANFIETESKIKCAVEYEQRVIEMSLKFGKNLIELSQGDLPKSRNLKKK